MKPSIVQQIESQTRAKLSELKGLNDLLDSIRHKHNGSFVLDGGALVALNFTGSESPMQLELSVGECASLQYLNLERNPNLTDLRLAGPLPKLKWLNLGHSGLEALTVPAGCAELEKAWLQKNKLQRMVFEAGCPKLLLLDLAGNQLEQLSFPIGFKSLAYLYLNENKLEVLQFEDGTDAGSPLPALDSIHLRNNNLRMVPENIIFTESLNSLYLAGNAPKNIPKVFLKSADNYYAADCLEDARAWFSQERTEKNEVVKLMLTGNGSAGKTTLLCAMRNGRCPHDEEFHKTTHGVQMESLPEKGITYNVWDFGGQEVYHGTHRLFMAAEALQVILCDPGTEEIARSQKLVEDRKGDDMIRHHPVQYWYETSSGLSPDSQFFIAQNKKDKYKQEDPEIRQYAADVGAKYIHLSAVTGAEMDELQFNLRKYAQRLPDYDMLMPASWLKVRQFFIDNLNAPVRKKIIDKNFFDQLCEDAEVMPVAKDLLFRYLHHNGFLYHHKNLGNHIIADQRWALDAIYKPLERGTDHYKEFQEDRGQIKVRRLFEVFGEAYEREEKWLFLSFLQSCGLCFQLNNRPEHQHEKSESDIYVFPEFLPGYNAKTLESDWQRAQNVKVLRYRLPWLNYYVIQSFITALGRKTETKNIWRNGIQVSTPDGWFKVEMDYEDKAILLHIEERAMAKWLLPILEEMEIGGERGKEWVYAHNSEPFDADAWKQSLSHKMEGRHAEMPIEQEESLKEGEKQVSKRLEDVAQTPDKQVVLFFAANPTAEKLSLRNEHSTIAEKLSDKAYRCRFDCVPIFGGSVDELIDAVHRETPAIIHFAGHGEEVNPDSKKGGGLIFYSDDKQGQVEIDAEKLGKIFQRLKKKHAQLKIVILNACFSEPQAIAISGNNIYTIGVSDELESIVARPFAAGFYREYADCDSVENAVDSGITKALSGNAKADELIHLYFEGKKIDI